MSGSELGPSGRRSGMPGTGRLADHGGIPQRPPAMRSVVELDIEAPPDRVEALFARPELIPGWMDDVARYEPMIGEPGTPGSQYRLVPKSGGMEFVATVLAPTHPHELRLLMEGSSATVSV